MDGRSLESESVDSAPAAAAVAALAAQLRAGLIGHEVLVERLMTALLAGGHVLIEGPPGLAKTRAVKRLADGLDGSSPASSARPT